MNHTEQHLEMVGQQEPVAKVCHDLEGHIGWNPNLKELPDEGTELYASPPKRQAEGAAWQGLTDEERRDIREWKRIQEELSPVWAPMMLYLYEAIEAKLKEKNT